MARTWRLDLFTERVQSYRPKFVRLSSFGSFRHTRRAIPCTAGLMLACLKILLLLRVPLLALPLSRLSHPVSDPEGLLVCEERLIIPGPEPQGEQDSEPVGVRDVHVQESDPGKPRENLKLAQCWPCLPQILIHPAAPRRATGQLCPRRRSHAARKLPTPAEPRTE